MNKAAVIQAGQAYAQARVEMDRLRDTEPYPHTKWREACEARSAALNAFIRAATPTGTTK